VAFRHFVGRLLLTRSKASPVVISFFCIDIAFLSLPWAKIALPAHTTEIPSYSRTQYININKIIRFFMKNDVFDPLSAACRLTALTLGKAAVAFHRMHRVKEQQYKLAHGTISGV